MPPASNKFGAKQLSMEDIYPSDFRAPPGLQHQVMVARSKEKFPKE